MRYMILVKSPEPAPPPSSELIAEMGVFNDKLIKAGVLLAAEGLQPSATGAKVKKESGQIVVRDGPFAEAKELIGGFWIIKADSLAEAVGWVKQAPLHEGGELEVRRVSEISDFVHDGVSGQALDREQAWRDAQEGSNSP